MNGTEKMKIPKFLEGEPLQEGYFDGTNPYIDHPTCKIDFCKWRPSSAAFAELNGRDA